MIGQLDINLTTPGDQNPLSSRRETSNLAGGADPGSTSLSFDLEVKESDLNFPSPLGSLDVDVVGGSFAIDADGGPVPGAEVRVVMTEAACEFVTSLTFESLSENPVHIRMFGDQSSGTVSPIEHIDLARWPDARTEW